MAVNMSVCRAHPFFMTYVSSLLAAVRRVKPTILGHVFEQIRKQPHNLQYWIVNFLLFNDLGSCKVFRKDYIGE